MVTFDDLKPYVGVLRKVRLERDFPGESTRNGFILGLSDALILLQQFHDFYCEGYTLLRVPDVTAVQSGQYERFWERMLHAEGILDNVGISYDVPIQGIGSALSWLAGRAQNIAVEIESRVSSNDDEFYLGRIDHFTDDAFGFFCFDALGEWTAEPIMIRMDEVTKIQFDTPYINIFSKHLRQPNP